MPPSIPFSCFFTEHISFWWEAYVSLNSETIYHSVKGARWKEQTAQHWPIKKEQSSVPGDLGSSLIPVLIKSHDLKSITWPGSNFFRKSRKCTTWPLRSLSESYDILGERFAIRKAQWFYISYLNTPFSWGKNGPGSWRVRKPSVCLPVSLLALPSSHTHSILLICILLSFSFHTT